MGTDCAPLLANLFQFFYEYKYMRNMIRTNLVLAMRYIDDLLTLNNPSFQTVTYPHELQLKIATECETKLSYLVTIERFNLIICDRARINQPYAAIYNLRVRA